MAKELKVLIPLNRVIVIEWITYGGNSIFKFVLIPLNRVIVIEFYGLPIEEIELCLNPLKSGHCY